MLAGPVEMTSVFDMAQPNSKVVLSPTDIFTSDAVTTEVFPKIRVLSDCMEISVIIAKLMKVKLYNKVNTALYETFQTSL